MNIDEFWKLNEGLPVKAPEDVLAERLTTLDPVEIVSFQKHFDESFAKAYQWDLWAAAYVINGGCSDDGFTDFRYGLISRGREIYQKALQDPETLIEIAVGEEEEEFISNELFGYVAHDIYESKMNAGIPANDVEHPTNPDGVEWDFDDQELCKQKLPKLWARFGI